MTLHVVRHAEAGARPDEVRPLDATGRAQADQLAELLAGRAVGRILSSRYQRCMETITPLAERLGLSIECHPALAEEAGVDDAWALLESLATEDVVVCSHGNIISPVLDRVRRRGADIVAVEWSCRKASVWALDPGAPGTFERATLLT